MKTLINVLTIVLALSSYDLLKISVAVLSTAQSTQSIKELPVFIKPKSNNKDYQSLVRIHSIDGRFVCSGSLISTKYILTAAHCLVDKNGFMVKDKYTIHLTKSDGSIEKINATAATIDRTSDNALMTGSFDNLSYANLALGAAESVTREAKPFTCGYPYGSDESICYQASSEFRTQYFRIVRNGILYPGMSGGPVIDLNTNKVIGVNSAVGNSFIVTTSLVGLFEQLGVTHE